MPTTQTRPVTHEPLKTDPFIRQQDTCTPWGLHYNAYQDAYQDTYGPLPALPTTRRTPRKHITA